MKETHFGILIGIACRFYRTEVMGRLPLNNLVSVLRLKRRKQSQKQNSQKSALTGLEPEAKRNKRCYPPISVLKGLLFNRLGGNPTNSIGVILTF